MTLCLLSPVSKGLHTSFNSMKTLEYFYSMGRFNTRKKGLLGNSLPSLPVYAQPYSFLLRHLMLHTFRVSLSTQFPCCFKLLTFSISMHWCPASAESNAPVTAQANLNDDSLSSLKSLILRVSGYRRKLESAFSITWKSKINLHLFLQSFWFLLQHTQRMYKLWPWQ